MHGRTRNLVQAGFSLVELLVVIAIIIVLAAILFPVLARAKERAKQTTCMSNLHQLALKTEIGNSIGSVPSCPLSESVYRGAGYIAIQQPLVEYVEQVDPGHARWVCYLHGEHIGWGVQPADFTGTVLRLRGDGSVRVAKVTTECLDGRPVRPAWTLFSDAPCPPQFCPTGLQPCP